MSHKNKQSLHQQVHSVLQSKQAFGRSKHDDKKTEQSLGLPKGEITKNYIYSFSTMKDYTKQANLFVRFCKESEFVKNALGHTPKTLDEIKPFLQTYLDEKNFSASTEKLIVSALSKVYGERLEVETKQKRLQDITRSRNDVVRDAHFSESKNAELVNLCRCVGFRRMELEKAKASDLVMLDGKYYVSIVGKGGKERFAPVVGTADEVKHAVEYLQKLDGHNHVSTAMDVHSYRADYATKVYKQEARPVASLKGAKIDYTAITGKWGSDGKRITKSAIYWCQGFRKGLGLDRRALLIASQALGHNRESVTGAHYVRL